MLEPRGTLELDPAELNFLKGEDSELAGVVGRNEGLGADRFEIADEELAADDTAPPAAIGLDRTRLQAKLAGGALGGTVAP